MSLKLYNTATRSKDVFETLEPGKVGLYTCGPTVYNYAHIGNLRTYIFEDILKRVLIACDYEVNHVMNVTDVGHLVSDADDGEDKMAVGAQREGKTVWEIADFYWQAFRADLERLHIIEPTTWCKATDHIDEQIDQVKVLEDKGFTYRIDDGIYFDTSKLPDYGKLARQDLSALKAGARVEMGDKRNPTDFSLWKFSPTDRKRLMEWDSPWGVGFPGWHIECSSMAMKYLGERLDIHCGGIDHIAVHHTNEIAQAEAAMGHDWCNWWLHGEFLVLPKADSDDEDDAFAKMAKSGEFLKLDLLVERGYDPLAYRYLCFTGHYRQQLVFTWEALDAAASAMARLKRAVPTLKREYHKGSDRPVDGYLAEFDDAVRDDLNMPRALAAMWGVLQDANASGGEKYATLLAMESVLGFRFDKMEAEHEEFTLTSDQLKALEECDADVTDAELEQKLVEVRRQRNQARNANQLGEFQRWDGECDELVKAYLCRRSNARREKDFARADRMRDFLGTIGIGITDRPGDIVIRKEIG